MKWSKGPRLAGSDFGNPLFLGGTAYTLCLHDAEGRLVYGYVVAQGGARCGARRCWKPVGKVPPSRKRHRGYRYRDPAAATGGLRKLDLVAGRANASEVRVAGSNNRAKGRSSLPTGIAAALRESTGGVTIQLFSNQVPVGCLSETLRTVVNSGAALYRVKKR